MKKINVRHISGLAMVTALLACATTEEDEADGLQRFAAEEAFPGETGELVTGLVELGGSVSEVTYAVIDGQAVLGGDIILGPADAVAARSEELAAAGDRFDAATRTSSSARWPYAVVPYQFAAGFPSGRREEVMQAIRHWNHYTFIRLVDRTLSPSSYPDYIEFVDGSGCSSSLGRVGSRQTITLASGCGYGSALHEIGHALGLYHEQQRADRDSFVTINWNNIQGGATGTTATANFRSYVERGLDGADPGLYDFGSIMQYSSDAFSNGNGPTITRKDGSEFDAQRDIVSDFDIAGLTDYYLFNSQQTFRFRSNNSFMCLDIPDASRYRNRRLQQYPCHSGANQKWDFYDVPNTSRVLIINAHSKMCLTATWDLAGTGVILQRPCTGKTDQQWNLYSDNGLRIRNEFMQRCMDVANASLQSNAWVNHYPCHQGANQSWGYY